MSWSGLPENIENKIMPEPNTGCWFWLGGMRDAKEGYGGFPYEGKTWRTHRLVYTLLRGPVAKELDIDHLCRNRICCNPEHLEPCTRKTNIHRGKGIAAKNLVKTHCSQGHAYTEENTYVWGNQRFCKTCHKKYGRAYDAKRVFKRNMLAGLIDPWEDYYANA